MHGAASSLNLYHMLKHTKLLDCSFIKAISTILASLPHFHHSTIQLSQGSICLQSLLGVHHLVL